MPRHCTCSARVCLRYSGFIIIIVYITVGSYYSYHMHTVKNSVLHLHTFGVSIYGTHIQNKFCMCYTSWSTLLLIKDYKHYLITFKRISAKHTFWWFLSLPTLLDSEAKQPAPWFLRLFQKLCQQMTECNSENTGLQKNTHIFVTTDSGSLT